jgi:hypothetical protein
VVDHVTPVSSIAPTCWLLPLTSNIPPLACWLLLMTFTRLEPDDKAATEPDSSSVAPLAIVTVSPVPIVAVPYLALNCSVPPVRSRLLLPFSVGAPSISSVPSPAALKVPVVVRSPVDVSVAPAATLTIAAPVPD